MATEVITTANKPIAADISTARKQFVQAIQTLDVKGANLTSATDSAARNTLAGVTNGDAMRDICNSIGDVITIDTSTATLQELKDIIDRMQILINQYA